DLCFRPREGMLAHRLLDDRSYLLPRARDLPNDHDHVGRQTGDQRRESQPEILRHLLQRFHRFAIALLRQAQQMIETDRVFNCRSAASATRGTSLRVVTNGSRVRRIHLPTTSIATTAFETLLNKSGVSEFASRAS